MPYAGSGEGEGYVTAEKETAAKLSVVFSAVPYVAICEGSILAADQ